MNGSSDQPKLNFTTFVVPDWRQSNVTVLLCNCLGQKYKISSKTRTVGPDICLKKVHEKNPFILLIILCKWLLNQLIIISMCKSTIEFLRVPTNQEGDVYMMTSLLLLKTENSTGPIRQSQRHNIPRMHFTGVNMLILAPQPMAVQELRSR